MNEEEFKRFLAAKGEAIVSEAISQLLAEAKATVERAEKCVRIVIDDLAKAGKIHLSGDISDTILNGGIVKTKEIELPMDTGLPQLFGFQYFNEQPTQIVPKGTYRAILVLQRVVKSGADSF